jgi:Tfp pilus assembly protein PilX
MKTRKRHFRAKGIALVVAMIFVAVFAALSVGFLSLSSANTQISSNHRDGNNAMNAALSGLDCAMYVVRKASMTDPIIKSGTNFVTEPEATQMWGKLCTQFQTTKFGNVTVPNASAFTDSGGAGVRIFTPSNISCQTSGTLNICFYRYNSAPFIIWIEAAGTDGGITRRLKMKLDITKDSSVMNYAIAGRGRMWLTGDTTVHGSIYSAWNLSDAQLTQLAALEEQLKIKIAAGTLNSTSFAALVSSLSLTTTNRTTILNELTSGTLTPEKATARCIGLKSTTSLSVAPFNMTSDSTVLGTISTCWSKEQVIPKTWQLETLDSDGNPMFDEEGNRIYSADDEIQGYHEGILYGETPQNMAGMNIGDYYDDSGNSLTATVYKAAIPTTVRSGTASVIANGVLGKTGVSTVTEYYPHAAGSYTTKASSSSLTLTRYKYENKTLQNVTISSGTNAVFKNCTFDDVLYVDCGTSTSTYNNVRFENCTFNGPIITNAPQTLNWQKNCLYFTGSATFNNTSAIQEATILAPNFNVNLGNNNSNQNDNNVLTGAIIGGIVDIRGNAQINGTVISMADTSAYTSGYVTNIGATLLDGGSETVEIDDIGTIEITPDPTNMLPSGVKTPIILKPQANSYQECN